MAAGKYKPGHAVPPLHARTCLTSFIIVLIGTARSFHDKDDLGSRASESKMKADSASHLIRHPIKFEAFLFSYLVCALVLQKVNIYKSVSNLHGGRKIETSTDWFYNQNFHLIDVNLVLLTVVILCRRLAWCAFQTFQFRWRINDSSKGIGTKRLVVFICALLVLVLSVIQLIQKTSLFNLLFLFYP